MRKLHGKWVFTRSDCFSLDETLRPIIHAGLVKFKNDLIASNIGGVPSAFLPTASDPDDGHTEEEISQGFNLWLAELDKMIYAFDSTNEPNYNSGFIEGPDHGKKTGPSTSKWDMKPVDPVAWEEYIKLKREYETKCQEGFESFGKYFRNLWW